MASTAPGKRDSLEEFALGARYGVIRQSVRRLDLVDLSTPHYDGIDTTIAKEGDSDQRSVW